jgi:uncharacterized protein
MRLMNKTRNCLLSDEVLEARNFAAKSLGMIRYDKPRSLLLRTRFGIHTFGMKYPIDVLVLDVKNAVVDSKQELQPNRVFFWNVRYQTVIELPSKTLEKTGTQLGDVIEYVV